MELLINLFFDENGKIRTAWAAVAMVFLFLMAVIVLVSSLSELVTTLSK